MREGDISQMKIFAAGIATETNSFSPIPTGLEDFQVQRGTDVEAGRVDYPGLNLAAVWGKSAKAQGHHFTFSLMAFAQPGGITVRSAYELLRDEILEDLRNALPVDIVFLMLHGAMLAQGYDDCEEDLIRRVRNVTGPETVIGVELDLHCHLSEAKIARADIVMTYKEYPHVDVNERAGELYELALATKLGSVLPKMALFDCRMVGIYPTSRQPMRGFVDAMKGAERRNGILSISFGHGYPFADVPHIGAKVLVVADNDAELARQVARELGLAVYGLRREIGFDTLSLSMEEALTRALASTRRPVVVADQSDNAGGGAPGDATFALRWLLEHQATEVAMGTFYDPEVVRIAMRAGRGATLPVRLGGKLGPLSGDPVDIEVTVIAIRENYMYSFPLESGELEQIPTGTAVALRGNGIDIVVSSERCQCFSPAIFSDLGIDPTLKRVLVPKSTQHFHAAFAPLAAELLYMAGPGAVPPDPRQIGYRRVNLGNLYPWNEDPLST
jgi:microcystin degradation protein MlrC